MLSVAALLLLCFGLSRAVLVVTPRLFFPHEKALPASPLIPIFLPGPNIAIGIVLIHTSTPSRPCVTRSCVVLLYGAARLLERPNLTSHRAYVASPSQAACEGEAGSSDGSSFSGQGYARRRSRGQRPPAVCVCVGVQEQRRHLGVQAEAQGDQLCSSFSGRLEFILVALLAHPCCLVGRASLSVFGYCFLSGHPRVVILCTVDTAAPGLFTLPFGHLRR